MFTYLLYLLVILTTGVSASGPNVSITPAQLDFGPWRQGATVTDTVRIKNISGSSFTLASVALTPSGPFLSPSPITPATPLDAGATAHLPISFSPLSIDSHAASLDLEIDGLPHRVPISGEGVLETLVINEILADPPGGPAGDANNDGLRNSSEDEFVELLNISHYVMDLSAHTLSDRGAKHSARFAFPEGTLLGPDERLVLFGGGVPSGFSGKVFVDDGKIGGGLTNSGDAVYLIDALGDTVSTAEYGKEAGADQSLVRHPDGRGPFVKHKTPPSLERYSPGRIRSPVTGIQTIADTLAVLLGDRVSPAVIAFSGQDTFDVTADVTWMPLDSALFTTSGDALLAIRPGETQILAFYDTLRTAPLIGVSTLPDPFALKTTPEDTVVLKDTELSVSVSAVAGNTQVGVDDLVAWDSSGPTLERTSPMTYIPREAGVGTITFRLSPETTSLNFISAVPGDFDLDGSLTTADILRLIHIALEIPPPPEAYEWVGADANLDGEVDVADLVLLVERLIGQPATTKPQPVAAIHWEQVGTTLRVSGSPVSFLVVEMQDPGSVASADYLFEGARQLWFVRPKPGNRIELPLSLHVSSPVNSVHAGTHLPARQQASALSSFPNPFNAQTILTFAIGNSEDVTLDIYSVIGQRVVRLAQGLHAPGIHRIHWDGHDYRQTRLGSGVYLAQLTTRTRTETVRMVLLQ